MQLLDGLAEPAQPVQGVVEEGLEVGPVDPADGHELGHRLVLDLGEQVLDQPLGSGGPGRGRQCRDVVAHLGEAEGQRARVVGVDHQQLEDPGGTHVAAVATAVGDRGLRGLEHRVEDRAVHVDAAAHGGGGAQQVDQLQRALQRATGADHVPPVVAHHAREDALQGQHAGEDAAGGVGDLVAVRVLRQRLVRPLDDAEGAPGVGGELVAHVGEGGAEVLDRVGHRADPVGVGEQRAELSIEVVELPPGEATDGAEQHREAGAADGARAGAEVLGDGVGDDEQPQHVLGALGVPSDPEEVLEHAGHGDRDGARGGHRHHLGQPLVGVGRVGLEHPDVLAGRGAEAAVVVDVGQPTHQRPVGPAVAQGEGPQRHRPRARGAAAPRRHLGERQPLLPDVAVRLVEDPLDDPRRRQSLQVGGGAVDGSQVQRAGGVLQGVQHRAQAVGLSAPVGGEALQQQRLAEQRLAGGGEVRRQAGVLQHAGPEPVDDPDAPAAHRLDEPGDAQLGLPAQLQRVGPGGVDTTQDHVDALHASTPLAQVDPPVTHQQVAALHQREAERGGDEGLVVGGLGVRARREHHDPGVGEVAVGGLDERGSQRPEVGLHPVQAGLAVELGDDAGDDATVLHRVAQPRGRLGAVADDPPVAGGVAGQVGGGEDQRPRVDRLLAQRAPRDRPGEAAVAEHDRGRDDALGEQPLLAVQVDEQGVEELGALGQALLQGCPGGGVDDQRDRVEAPRALSVAGPRVGDAVVGEEAGDVAVDAVHVRGGQRDRQLGQALPGRAQRPVGADHLVEATGAVGVAQRGLGRGGGVVAEDRHPALPRTALTSGAAPGRDAGRGCARSPARWRGPRPRASRRRRACRRCARAARSAPHGGPPPPGR